MRTDEKRHLRMHTEENNTNVLCVKTHHSTNSKKNIHLNSGDI